MTGVGEKTPVPLTPPPCSAFVALGAFETACGDDAADVQADKSVVAAPDEGALDVPLVLPPLVDETASWARESCDNAHTQVKVNAIKTWRLMTGASGSSLGWCKRQAIALS